MAVFFIILLFTVWLATSMFFNWASDGFDDEWIYGLIFGLGCASCSFIFLTLVVVGNGYSIVKKVSEGKLDRLQCEKDVCYLVKNDDGYLFHTGDSTFQVRSIICHVEHIEEADSPRMECFSVEPKPWALLFFKSGPFLLKEKYVLYVPKKYVKDKCVNYPVEYY